MKKKLFLIDKISLLVILLCFFALLCFIFFGGLFTSNVRLTDANNSGQVFNYETMKLNVNTASVDELISLNHIGKKIAMDIIIYRNANGPFKTIDELIEIKGIGQKTLDEIKKYLAVE